MNTPIVYISDANYFWPLVVSINSTIRQADQGIILLVNCGFSDDQLRLIQPWLENSTDWTFQMVDWQQESVEMSSKHITYSAFTLLHLPEIFPELDEVLVLDPDTLVRHDLQQFSGLREKDAPILGCRDQTFPTMGDAFSEEIRTPLRLNAAVPYLNSGVLALSLQHIRRAGIFEQAMEIKSQWGKALWGAEQQPLNIALNGSWQEADWRWNCQTPRHANRKEAHIQHMTSGLKPWNGGVFSPWWPEYYSQFLKEKLTLGAARKEALRQIGHSFRKTLLRK
jgi:lipopolysaccharide biosynthesis glycosyltransferase